MVIDVQRCCAQVFKVDHVERAGVVVVVCLAVITMWMRWEVRSKKNKQKRETVRNIAEDAE